MERFSYVGCEARETHSGDREAEPGAALANRNAGKRPRRANPPTQTPAADSTRFPRSHRSHLTLIHAPATKALHFGLLANTCLDYQTMELTGQREDISRCLCMAR